MEMMVMGFLSKMMKAEYISLTEETLTWMELTLSKRR